MIVQQCGRASETGAGAVQFLAAANGWFGSQHMCPCDSREVPMCVRCRKHYAALPRFRGMSWMTNSYLPTCHHTQRGCAHAYTLIKEPNCC
jgi:hypothetical protein